MARQAKTQYAILGILTFGPQSGYEIAKFCREVIKSFWNESYGQIYPQLKQLVELGWVKKSESDETNRRKSLYTITKKGRNALEKWAAEPAEPQPVRNETLLKVFFGAALPSRITRQQVEWLLQSQEQLLALLKQNRLQVDELEEFDEHQKRHFRMTIRMGILIAQARIKWAKECLAKGI